VRNERLEATPDALQLGAVRELEATRAVHRAGWASTQYFVTADRRRGDLTAEPHHPLRASPPLRPQRALAEHPGSRRPGAPPPRRPAAHRTGSAAPAAPLGPAPPGARRRGWTRSRPGAHHHDRRTSERGAVALGYVVAHVEPQVAHPPGGLLLQGQWCGAAERVAAPAEDLLCRVRDDVSRLERWHAPRCPGTRDGPACPVRQRRSTRALPGSTSRLHVTTTTHGTAASLRAVRDWRGTRVPGGSRRSPAR
jgi:hypothetical protein